MVNNNNNTYNQPPMGQMPPQQPPMPMRQRMMKGMRRMQEIFPRWLSIYPIVTYILAMTVVSFIYSSYTLPWYYIIMGVFSILIFFLYGGKVANDNSIDRVWREKRFERRIFIMAFIPRVLFMFLLYEIFQTNYGDAFGFEASDALFYDELGVAFAESFQQGDFISTWKETTKYLDISDMGYGYYLGFIYWISNNSIIVARLLKCIWSSLTVLLIYRLAKRNFGDQTGRIAAMFCALWPNFWYYCAVHLKETEMAFLAVLFIEQADQMLRSRQFTAWKIIPVLLIAAALFTVRTPLGLVALLSLVLSVVMSSTKVVTWGKRVIVGGLAIALIGIVAGNQLEEQTRGLFEQVQDGYQEGNMKWRSERKDQGGNQQKFAKYAGSAVFAPMIFTLPFPTMVRPFEGQEVQQFLHGSNFVKNIISYFTILAMILLLMSGRWREHLLPLSFMLGYLVVVALSAFAHSERFHQPAMPIEMMFAAYGLSIAVTKPKYKRWFMYWCALMFIASIVWNWFKLAGRGLT